MTLELQYKYYKGLFPETIYTFDQWKVVVMGYTLEQFLNERFPDRVSILNFKPKEMNNTINSYIIDNPIIENCPPKTFAELFNGTEIKKVVDDAGNMS